LPDSPAARRGGTLTIHYPIQVGISRDQESHDFEVSLPRRHEERRARGPIRRRPLVNVSPSVDEGLHDLQVVVQHSDVERRAPIRRRFLVHVSPSVDEALHDLRVAALRIDDERRAPIRHPLVHVSPSVDEGLHEVQLVLVRSHEEQRGPSRRLCLVQVLPSVDARTNDYLTDVRINARSHDLPDQLRFVFF
jgi:hypothetical protein